MSATLVLAQLRAQADPAIAAHSARFFKTGPGQYGAGDVFVGVRVPALRRLAKRHAELSFDDLAELLACEIHEARLTALLVLTLRAARADDDALAALYAFYREHLDRVNNWDLVDTSAPAVVGRYFATRDRAPLRDLARSANLWRRRVAIVATQHFIRADDFADTLTIAETLLGDREDLIHKAVGWMLREVGKRDAAPLRAFLNQHAAQMPRTMLRYAIERLPDGERRDFLTREAAG